MHSVVLLSPSLSFFSYPVFLSSIFCQTKKGLEFFQLPSYAIFTHTLSCSASFSLSSLAFKFVPCVYASVKYRVWCFPTDLLISLLYLCLPLSLIFLHFFPIYLLFCLSVAVTLAKGWDVSAVLLAFILIFLTFSFFLTLSPGLVWFRVWVTLNIF